MCVSADDAAGDEVAAGLAADAANDSHALERFVHLGEQLNHFAEVADEIGTVRRVHASVLAEDGENLLDLSGLFGNVVVKDGRLDLDRLDLDGLFDRHGARIGCKQPDFLRRKLFVRGIDFVDFHCRGSFSFYFCPGFPFVPGKFSIAQCAYNVNRKMRISQN